MNISNLQQVVEINKQLENLYGIHTIKNLPNFRLAYAGEQYEKRSGEFSVYSGDIYLRTETGIHEVKKYPQIEDDIWIVERLVPNQHQDVMEGDYIYECLYAFKKIDHIPPIRAIEFLIRSLFVINGTQLQPKTEKEAIEKDNEKKKKETKKIREMLDTEFDYTDISMRLKHGAAVTDFNSKIEVKSE